MHCDFTKCRSASSTPVLFCHERLYLGRNSSFRRCFLQTQTQPGAWSQQLFIYLFGKPLGSASTLGMQEENEAMVFVLIQLETP